MLCIRFVVRQTFIWEWDTSLWPYLDPVSIFLCALVDGQAGAVEVPASPPTIKIPHDGMLRRWFLGQSAPEVGALTGGTGGGVPDGTLRACEAGQAEPVVVTDTNETKDDDSCRAPIASLECMEEFAAAVEAPNPPHPPISRQSSVTPGIRYRNLGKSGLRISNVGLGTWATFGSQMSDEVAEEVLTYAYENGINIFDTAEVYAAGKAEVVLGKILKKKGWRRSTYVVTTKLYWGGKAETERGLSRKHIIEGLQSSLERLQLPYVDVVFANKADPMCPMEEVVRAFTYCINHGMAMYWGTSRWSAMEIMEAYTVARQFNLIPPICEQSEYHMFCRDKVELYLPELYHKIGVGTMTWSPLACGVLGGKYDDGIPIFSRASLKGYTWLKDKIQSDEGKKQQSKLHEVALLAEKLGCTLSQLVIAWCLKNDSVHCVLLGASSVDQLAENFQALQVVPKLNTHVMNELDRILDNKPVRQPLQR